jgi:hypothetical protein
MKYFFLERLFRKHLKQQLSLNSDFFSSLQSAVKERQLEEPRPFGPVWMFKFIGKRTSRSRPEVSIFEP